MTDGELAPALRAAAPTATIVAGNGVDGYEVDGLRPRAVALPADEAGVAALLRLASERGWAVVPRGGGTMLDLGNVPSRLDLVLDLSRMNRLLEHRPADLNVTVEAGMTIDALQAALGEHGQMLALDPPLAGVATVGGVLAANAAGPRRTRWGTARDLLIGSRAVYADGTVGAAGGVVVKNVAGYDLNKLLVGSLGTLAVITRATFKVTPRPRGFGMVVACFSSYAEAQAVALAVLNSPLAPLSLDLIGPPAAAALTAGCRAEPAAGHWLLAAELGGAPAAVERTTRELVLLSAGGGSPEVTALELGQRTELTRRIRDYGRSLDDPATLILRLSVLPSEGELAVRAVQAASAGEAAPAMIVRPASGAVLSYWDDGWTARAGTLTARLRDALRPIGGTVVVEHAPPPTKAGLDVWGIEGADVELMRRVKATYDPADVLSPGRLP